MFSFEEKKGDEDEFFGDEFEVIEIEFNDVVSWLQKRLLLPEPIGPYINELDVLKGEGLTLVEKEPWWEEFKNEELKKNCRYEDDIKFDLLTCERIFSEVKEKENTILFSSKILKTWKEMVKLYKDKKLYVAETAFTLIKLVNFEIPFCVQKTKKNIRKMDKARIEIHKLEQRAKKFQTTYIKLFRKYNLETISSDENEIPEQLKISSKKQQPRKMKQIFDVLFAEMSLISNITQIYKEFKKKVSKEGIKQQQQPENSHLVELTKLLSIEYNNLKVKEKPRNNNKKEEEEVDEEIEDGGEQDDDDLTLSKKYFENHGEKVYNELLELQGFLRNETNLPHHFTIDIEKKRIVLENLDKMYQEYEEILLILTSSSLQKRITKSFTSIKIKIRMIETQIDNMRKRIAFLIHQNEEFSEREKVLVVEKNEKKKYLEKEILKSLEGSVKGKDLRIRIINSNNPQNNDDEFT